MNSQTQPLTVSNKAARNFLLSHHFLLPPKQLRKKQITSHLFSRLGCIQFDSINVVGRNADLVLQSRVKNYNPKILNSLLYESRELIDGWDKVASIFPVADWPFFSRHRSRMGEYHAARSPEALQSAPAILEAIKDTGPMSSLEFKDSSKTDWFWGPTSLARASLEILYSQGQLGVDHRINTRRYFNLINRLVPEKILKQPNPFQADEEYIDWHLLRRIRGLGIASMQSGEHWGGIYGARKVKQRSEAFSRLLQSDKVIPITIDNTSGREYYIHSKDLDNLLKPEKHRTKPQSAAFIAPLDNLIWNRNLIEDIFDFSYTWEVYKPKSKREFGYYVLPVLFKDKFIARTDMKFDKKTKTLLLKNWWWEDSFSPEDELFAAISSALKDFLNFLEGERLEVDFSKLASRNDVQMFKKVQKGIE